MCAQQSSQALVAGEVPEMEFEIVALGKFNYIAMVALASAFTQKVRSIRLETRIDKYKVKNVKLFITLAPRA